MAKKAKKTRMAKVLESAAAETVWTAAVRVVFTEGEDDMPEVTIQLTDIKEAEEE